MTEDEFFKATPKKLFKLAEIHREVNSYSSSNSNKTKPDEKYIDQISL